MSSILAEWNTASAERAVEAMLACCGARRWAAAMAAQRPFAGVDELMNAADRIWSMMKEPDWLEAFACHPRIGTRSEDASRSAKWSRQEQSRTESASTGVLAEMADKNALYEQLFGFTYIVCATGKTAGEMLAILNRRLANDRATELCEAAEQQRQITRIRLGKWASA